MKKILSIALLAVLALSFNSCVKDEMYPYATVSDMTHTIAYSEVDNVTVSAKISALVGIQSATLIYNVNGGAAQEVAMKAANNGMWEGVIPAQAKGAKVEYLVKVITDSNKESTSATNSYEVGKVPVDYTGLVLNELNGNDKFIELYNGGNHAIYLGDVKMYKDSNFDASTWDGAPINLEPGKYLVLQSEDLSPECEPYLIFHSGLSAKKSVRITIVGGDGKTIDDFNLNNDAGTKYAGSFGRNADGKWYHQTTKTPGAANVDGDEPLTMK